VLIELFKVPGAPFAAFVARLQEGNLSTAAVRRPDAWFVDRRGFAPVPPSSPRLLPRNAVVLLLVVDCLRADVLANPKHANQLPTLSALARRSVYFERTWTPAPATAVAIASVLTSRYYSQLYWRRAKVFGRRSTYLPDRDPSPRFQELLAEKGVVTVTYAADPGLRAETGLLGKFAEHGSVGPELMTAEEGDPGATAPELAARIVERLGRVGEGPLFLYAQFVDAHGPYEAAGSAGSEFERYLRVIGLVDAEIGRVLAAVTARGLGDRTAVIVTSDHGEAFGEHNDRYHGRTVYEVAVRVPLLISLPGPAARSLATPASLIDLGPTILDLFGLPTPGAYMGQSLVPALLGRDFAPTRPIVVDSGRLQQAMVFADGLKVMRDKRRGVAELYDLGTDPNEAHNLLDERPELAEQRLGLLQAFFEAHELKAPNYKTPYRPP
jgi:arylsulfatase A-like enzyme